MKSQVASSTLVKGDELRLEISIYYRNLQKDYNYQANFPIEDRYCLWEDNNIRNLKEVDYEGD